MFYSIVVIIVIFKKVVHEVQNKTHQKNKSKRNTPASRQLADRR